jgi:hypothetical protein
MPKKGRGKSGVLDPMSLPLLLKTFASRRNIDYRSYSGNNALCALSGCRFSIDRFRPVPWNWQPPNASRRQAA